MRVSHPNTEFHRDFAKKYEEAEYEDCPICGHLVRWPQEAAAWNEDGQICHVECVEKEEQV